jgi:ribosomal protein L29
LLPQSRHRLAAVLTLIHEKELAQRTSEEQR